MALILVVEDEPQVLKLISLVLVEEGRHTVMQAADGQAALQQLAKLRQTTGAGPDLIISDIMMPGMDGLTFCLSLKTDPLFQSIPIILVSGLPPARRIMAALSYQAFITKPFEVDELLDTVAAVLPT